MSDLWVSCCIFNQLSNPRGTTCRLPHRDMILGRLAQDGLLVIHRDPASPEALQLAPPLKWNMYVYIYIHIYIYIFKYNDMCVIYLLHLTLCQDSKILISIGPRVIQTSLSLQTKACCSDHWLMNSAFMKKMAFGSSRTHVACSIITEYGSRYDASQHGSSNFHLH